MRAVLRGLPVCGVHLGVGTSSPVYTCLRDSSHGDEKRLPKTVPEAPRIPRSWGHSLWCPLPVSSPPTPGSVRVARSTRKHWYVSSEIRGQKTLHLLSRPFFLSHYLPWGNPPPLCSPVEKAT